MAQKHVVRIDADGRKIATFGTGTIVCKLTDGRLLRKVMMKDIVVLETARALSEKARRAAEAAVVEI